MIIVNFVWLGKFSRRQAGCALTDALTDCVHCAQKSTALGQHQQIPQGHRVITVYIYIYIQYFSVPNSNFSPMKKSQFFHGELSMLRQIHLWAMRAGHGGANSFDLGVG